MAGEDWPGFRKKSYWHSTGVSVVESAWWSWTVVNHLSIVKVGDISYKFKIHLPFK